MTERSEKSPVFELLGADGDDIEALTAYALYKRHKRTWSAEFKIKHNRLPNLRDEQAFFNVASTQDQLDRYRKDALDILLAFAEQTVEEERPSIERRAITSRIERAASEISRQGALRKQVVAGLVVTAINTLVCILIATGLQLTGIDLVEFIINLSPQ